MRIGIDATCWANGRGYGRFTRELVNAMVPIATDHELVCFLDPRSAEQFTLRAPNVRPLVVEQSVAPTLAATSGESRSPIDMLRLTNAVRKARLDAFFSPSVYGYFPLPPGLPAVITIHDAIPERFPELTLPTWKDRLFWRLKVGLAIRQATLFVTTSEYGAGELVQYLGIARDRIRVTLVGIPAAYKEQDDPEATRAAARRAGVPDGARWLIYVGGFGPHKRVDLIARAHAAVARRHPDPPLMLLLVGHYSDGFHSGRAEIQAAIEAEGTQHLVKWTGFLPDEELRHLHAGAMALVLVSASEGFGLTAVEAARCGAPVIAATSSPLPQVLEGGGIFVEPDNLVEIEAAMERLISNEDERRAMGRQALARARELSWPKSAAAALAAIEEAARGRAAASRRVA